MTDDQLCELVGKYLPPYRILYQGDYYTFSFRMLLKCFLLKHKNYESMDEGTWYEHLIYHQFMEKHFGLSHQTN